MPPLVYNPKSNNTKNDQEEKILDMDIFLWGKSKLQGQTRFYWAPNLSFPSIVSHYCPPLTQTRAPAHTEKSPVNHEA